MSVSRRKFLAVGAGAFAAVTAGCDQAKQASNDVRRWIGKPGAPALEGSLAAPAGAELDEISHVLNRLTFGARPGDYARVAALGVRAFIEEQLAPERIDDFVCERVIRHEFDELGEPESRLFPRKADDSDPLHAMFPALRDHGARVGDLYEFKDKVLLRDLTRATLLRATLSHRQLYEVMVNFWSDTSTSTPPKARRSG